jgi:signal transduction histidine kinase
MLNKKQDPETIKKCLTFIDDIQNIEKEIRQVAHDLDQDLFSGSKSFNLLLETLFDEFRTVSGSRLFSEIDTAVDWERTETPLRMNIYRILQEALQNCNKYAQAKNIYVTMTREDQMLRIIVHDDGIGFDMKKVKKGIGLKNMSERVKSLFGKLDIRTKKGEGTIINILLPLIKP